MNTHKTHIHFSVATYKNIGQVGDPHPREWMTQLRTGDSNWLTSLQPCPLSHLTTRTNKHISLPNLNKNRSPIETRRLFKEEQTPEEPQLLAVLIYHRQRDKQVLACKHTATVIHSRSSVRHFEVLFSLAQPLTPPPAPSPPTPCTPKPVPQYIFCRLGNTASLRNEKIRRIPDLLPLFPLVK